MSIETAGPTQTEILEARLIHLHQELHEAEEQNMELREVLTETMNFFEVCPFCSMVPPFHGVNCRANI